MSKIIVLDPGHDHLSNVSPTFPAYIEGARMWMLAGLLRDSLANYGIQAVITRPKITDNPTLAQRGAMAGAKKACFFLSLHSNAGAETATGTEMFYSISSPKTKVLCDRLGEAVSKEMGHYYRGSKTRAYPDSTTLDYYGVIRSSVAAGCKEAAIIEHGFHTNRKDAQWLLVDDNLKKLAVIEAKILADYLGCELLPKK